MPIHHLQRCRRASRRGLTLLPALLLALLLGACELSVGTSEPEPPPAPPPSAPTAFTIGGTVSGLNGSGLVLQNSRWRAQDGGNSTIVPTNGPFRFDALLPNGTAYAVSVLSQPTAPDQTCTVTNGSGTIFNADVDDVRVDCVDNPPLTFTIRGTVSGLTGSGLVLQNNGGDDLAIAANGAFSFETPVVNGGIYAVTVLTQPTSPNQTCTVANGSGTVAGANVTDVAVTCVTDTYTVGGSVGGLSGSGLVLRNNGGNNLAISGNGSFTFSQALPDGTAYAVTVLTQPTDPAQVCAVLDGSGIVAGANVTDVDVGCFAPVVLQATAGDALVDLLWNAGDYPGASFNLCRAEQAIGIAFDNCAALNGGMLTPNVANPHVAEPLINGTNYWFQLEVVHASGHVTYSEVVLATPVGTAAGPLNDTGITDCGEEFSYPVTCPAAGYPGQDAEFGRDAVIGPGDKVGSGDAGFDFTRQCVSGEKEGEGTCPAYVDGISGLVADDGNDDWGCTLDHVTGLTWEVKAPNDSSDRYFVTSFQWADVAAYAGGINAATLCGHDDWRLPTLDELYSILHLGAVDPSIDENHLGITWSGGYWTVTPYAPDAADSAWQVDFNTGYSTPALKTATGRVRLVRGP
ncbi:MAG: DUF1566 domain-containing protein [Chromatiales bacterium]|nr:DUF1566 domain-containing protein [Chromatiales bacterium]